MGAYKNKMHAFVSIGVGPDNGPGSVCGYPDRDGIAYGGRVTCKKCLKLLKRKRAK